MTGSSTPRALVVTYHAVEAGHGPLFLEPDAFAAHLDVLEDLGATAVTVSELARQVADRSLRPRTVALTFDDGIASVVRTAAPLLAERGLRATVFCVAGHLGGRSDWPSAAPDAPALELAGADELARLARSGWEIGCHGMVHAPLVSGEPGLLERELVEAKRLLEERLEVSVDAYAYPYGALPGPAALRAVRQHYASAWTTAIGLAREGLDVHRLPRVDAHYLRRPALLRAAIAGVLRPYLGARRLGARARRTVRRDYVVEPRR